MPGPKSCTKPDVCTITLGCGPLLGFLLCNCLGNWGPIFSCATYWMAIPPQTHWAGAGLPGCRRREKPIFAQPNNIEKYTQGRFCPTGLATEAAPIAGAANPKRRTLPPVDPIGPALATRLLLHDEDLDLGNICGAGLNLKATAFLPRQSTQPLLETAPKVQHFTQKAQSNDVRRFNAHTEPPYDPKDWPIWHIGHQRRGYNRLSTP